MVFSPLRSTMTAGGIRSPFYRGEALSLSEQIAEQIATDIIHNVCKPGERIHEVALSEKFKVSRGPVREALRILEKVGLVNILPRKGAVVTNLTVEEVDDLFEIRALLLGLAARRAAEKKDPQLTEELTVRLQNVINILDWEGQEDIAETYMDRLQELSLLICARTGSERLTSIIFSLLYQTIRYSRISLSTKERRQQSATNWKNLIKMISDGDGDGAAAAAYEMVIFSKRTAMKLLAEREKHQTE